MTTPMKRVKELKEKTSDELVDIYLDDEDDRKSHAALRILRTSLTADQVDSLVMDKVRPDLK